MKTLEATRWWTKAGVQTLEQLARITGRRRTADASHGQCHTVGCCCLALAPISASACISSCNSVSTHHLRSWLCCGGNGRFFSCGECIRTRNSTCVGPLADYRCSFAIMEAFSC